MTIENKASFIVDLKGNVTAQSKAFGREIAAMGDKGSRSMRILSSSMAQSNRVLDVFDNKIVGFATGGGAVMLAKQLGNWQQQMAELGTQYNLTASDIEILNQTIWSTADLYKTSYGSMADAVTQFLERTNDLDSATENLENMALAMKGIGLSADDAGKKLGLLKNKGYSATEIKEILNATANATKFGTGNIKEQFNRVTDIASGTNWKSPEQFKQLLALERFGDKSLGDSGKATNALEQFYKAIQDPAKQEILRRNGVEVFKDSKTKELNDPMQLFLEMGKASRFNAQNIQDILGGDFVTLMQSFNTEEMQNNLQQAFNEATENLIDEKASANIATFNSALTSLINAGEKFAQQNLAQHVQSLADVINNLKPEQIDNYVSKIVTGLKVVGGAIAARYAFNTGKSVYDIFKGGNQKGITGVLGNAIGKADATPVYVTNWDEQSSNQSNKNSNPKSNNNNLNKSSNIVSAVLELVELSPKQQEHLNEHLNKMHKERLAKFDEGNDPKKYELLPASWSNALQNHVKKKDKPETWDAYDKTWAAYGESFIPKNNQKKTPDFKNISKDEIVNSLRTQAFSNMSFTQNKDQTQGEITIFVEPEKPDNNKDVFNFVEPEKTDNNNTVMDFKSAFQTVAELNAVKPPEPTQGEITIKIESEKGLNVKAQSVTAKNLDINVDTGNLRYGNY